MNFDIAYQIILPAMQKIAEVTHSYGWAIIILTIAFRLLVSPLVAQTTISMRRMTKLQPQMKRIQERYKENPELLQKKLMEFYGKNKINPVGGCLPTLIQLPLLFALYWTFNGPPFTDKTIDVKVNVVKAEDTKALTKAEVSSTNTIYISKKNVAAKVVVFPGNSDVVAGSDLTFATRAVEGQLPPDFNPQWRLVMPGGHQPLDSADGTGHFVFPTVGEYHVQAVIPGIAKNDSFGFISGLGKVATGANLLKPANFDIIFLVLLFGGTMFLSQKLTVPAPKLKPGQELDEQQLIQQQTMKTMPLATTAMFFFFPIPAGVYLYLVLSNVIQTLQTWLISRMPEAEVIEDPDDVPALTNGDEQNGGAANNNGRHGDDNDDSPKGAITRKEKKKSKRRKN